MGIREIGGYFPLELAGNGAFHPRGKAFLTARGALKQVLLSLFEAGRGPERLWIPTFMCPDVETAISEVAPTVKIVRYALDDALDPVGCAPEEADLAYFYNVFGLKGAFGQGLTAGTIWDNVHAFFHPPVPGCVTIYSARKFFGVPDGAYLYSPETVQVPAPAFAFHRSEFLLKRHDMSALAAYENFKASERELAAAPPAGMSHLARYILAGIDYDAARIRRLENFSALHRTLGSVNELRVHIDAARTNDDFVPFSYPLLISNGASLRERLIEKKVYIPLLWQDVVSRPEIKPFERHLALNTVHLPIDQRYREADMIEVLARAGF